MTTADDIRTGLEATFEDYAQRAEREGDRNAANVWRNAAAIAGSYVPRAPVPVPCSVPARTTFRLGARPDAEPRPR